MSLQEALRLLALHHDDERCGGAFALRRARRSSFSKALQVQQLPGIFCKGSFEHVLRLCRPESIPENFAQVRLFSVVELPNRASKPPETDRNDRTCIEMALIAQVASAHAYSGMYVLAVAARAVKEEVKTRDDAEKELSLLGAVRLSKSLIGCKQCQKDHVDPFRTPKLSKICKRTPSLRPPPLQESCAGRHG